jgi:hypothetical protein
MTVSDPQGKPLWQHVLDTYREIPDGSGGYFDRLHPFMPVFVIRDLQALRDLGEEPSVDEFRHYVRSIRREFGVRERKMVDIWKRLIRNPAHQFRVIREQHAEWDPEPYTVAERIIEQEGLSPSVPDRIEAGLCQRAHDLVTAAERGTPEEYAHAFRRMRWALETVRQLRRTRFGLEDHISPS